MSRLQNGRFGQGWEAFWEAVARKAGHPSLTLRATMEHAEVAVEHHLLAIRRGFDNSATPKLTLRATMEERVQGRV
jgi:hypothetical protein